MFIKEGKQRLWLNKFQKEQIMELNDNFQNPLAFAFGFCLGAFIDCDVCCCLDSATKTAKFANQSIKLFFTISVVAVTAGGISAGDILI